jgi:hypothetical protein
LIAIDSSVLIDLVSGGADSGAAQDAVAAAMSEGPVVVCEVVISEAVAGLGHSSILVDALEETGIGFSPLEQRAAVRAGEMQRRYRARAGSAPPLGRRTIPDFLIGAHALLQCHGLITRDAGFFRDYFKGLKVIVPKS